jgi:hypothetical protein
MFKKKTILPVSIISIIIVKWASVKRGLLGHIIGAL